MKLILIRHAKVNIRMPKRCNAKEFDEARAAYDRAPIHPVASPADKTLYPVSDFKFYVSTLHRTHETLRGLFGDVPARETDLLTEVPNRSFSDKGPVLPYPCYQALGRVGWFFDLARQPEGRRTTTVRAEKLVRSLEKKDEDCVLVSHEFYLYTLLRVLKRHGFRVKRKNPFRIRNLEMITAEKA